MNILLLLAHAIEEHDQIKLLSELGYDVFSIGGYIDPAHPHDPKRPALPDVPRHPELQAVVDGLGTSDNLRAAKDRIPDDIIDWADTIIVHHYEHEWIVGNWPRIKHKRVIWRTVGQSVEGNERTMAPLRRDGLQIVRYSPKERNIPGFAGEDALIRFYKDPDEWQGWTGDWTMDEVPERVGALGVPVGSKVVGPNIVGGTPFVLNITQHLAQREPYTNYGFWEQATQGLPRLALGPGSEAIGGPGEVSFDDMQAYLRGARCYLYTGTQPASYTLGLIEAMMTGIPVASIDPHHMTIFPYGPDLFEGHEIVGRWSSVAGTRKMLEVWLNEPEVAAEDGAYARQRAIELFGKDTIALQWAAFLGGGMTQADVERRLAGTPWAPVVEPDRLVGVR